MNLELEKIASRRRKNSPDMPSMGYLLDLVRAELGDRLAKLSFNGSHQLLVDFEDSDLLSVQNQVTRCSVLDGDSLHGLVSQSGPQFDLVVINLQLAWLDFAQTFDRVKQLLLPGGKLLFTTFGPDTLFELRQAWAQCDEYPHVHEFVDLHLLGDQLLRSGFKLPILDTDWQGIEFEDIDLLMEDLRHDGFHNVLVDRRRQLLGKQRLQRMRNGFPKNTPARITFEIIYGLAEVPDLDDGSIRVNSPRLNH